MSILIVLNKSATQKMNCALVYFPEGLLFLLNSNVFIRFCHLGIGKGFQVSYQCFYFLH